MKISQVFQESLKKDLPRVEGKTRIIDAISTLRSHELTALPVVSTRTTIPERAKRDSSSFAVTGYSIISKLSQIDPSRYARFLEEPCEQSTLSLGSIRLEDDIVSLLQTYESSTFGFAMVEDLNSIISVRDFLRLYTNGVLETSLTAGEVSSSPVFSMSPSAKLHDYFHETVRRKFRRVNMAGSRDIITDTDVLDYLLKKKEEIEKNPRKVLDTKLEELTHSSLPLIEGKTNISQAAKTFVNERIDSAFTERGIITPWDLVLKPWRNGRLKIHE